MGSLFFLKKEGFQLPPDKKIIKAAEYLAFVEGEEIIRRAREEADKIRAEASGEYEAERKKGYEKGLLEGKMNISLQMMDTVGRTVNYFAAVEEKVAEIVGIALKKILGELDERELILKVVRNALAIARNQKQITLRVCPAQREAVKEKIHELMAGFPGIGFIDVVADARLKEGGCILESEMGVVDASVEVQLEAIRKSLLKSFKKRA